MGWVVTATPRPLDPRERGPVSIVQQTERSPGPVWMGAVYLAPPAFDLRTVQTVVSGYTDSDVPHIHFLPSALFNFNDS